MKFESPETDELQDSISERLPILVFPNPQQISLSIRASALVFSDPESQKLFSLIERVAPSNATAYIKGETGTGRNSTLCFAYQYFLVLVLPRREYDSASLFDKARFHVCNVLAGRF